MINQANPTTLADLLYQDIEYDGYGVGLVCREPNYDRTDCQIVYYNI